MSENIDILTKIDEICPKGLSNRHSYFQLQYFVVGKEPTIQAKIHTCKKELISRKDEIESLSVGLDDLYDQKQLHEISIEEEKKGEGKDKDKNPKIKEIHVRMNRRKLKAIDNQIKSTLSMIKAKEEEANFLIGLYEKLIEIEPEKDWDSLDVQAEFWNARLSREIESRLLMGQSPSPDDFQTVLSLPPGMPVKEWTTKLVEQKREEIKNKLETSTGNKKS